MCGERRAGHVRRSRGRARRARCAAPGLARRRPRRLEHALERGDAAGVERRAGLGVEQRHRLLVRPRRRGRRAARSARRRRRRPRGSACRARSRRRRARPGSPLPSRRSWWSRTRCRTPSEKPPSSSSEPGAPVGVALDDRGTRASSSGPGFLRIASGTDELADVVDEARRSRACAAGRGERPRRRPDLHGAERDAAGVLLRVLVLLREPQRQRPHVRAEEDLLGGDELGGAQVTGERAGLRGVREVEGDGHGDDQDPVELEHVAEPPAEVGVGQRQRRDERDAEPRGGRSRRSGRPCAA